MNSRAGSRSIQYALKNRPIITSLVDKEDLKAILETTSNIVFILTGDIFSLERNVKQVKDAGKLAFVHFDLIDGIGKDQVGVRYFANKIGVDGIVTTRSNIISASKRYGLGTVQRLFAFDSVSIDNGVKVIRSTQPDAIEVLPGMVVPRIINKIRRELDIPVIAGGLITDVHDLEAALKSGAIGISTSSKKLWQWQDNL